MGSAGDVESARSSDSVGFVERRERLAAMDAASAVAAFDQDAWEMVLDAHDEEMRSGGLQLIFPTVDAKQYTQYFEQESFANVVLRKWHEAGGGAELFRSQPRGRALRLW